MKVMAPHKWLAVMRELAKATTYHVPERRW